MKIYTFSAELESAVIELLEDTTFLLPQLSNSDTPAYVKALRHLKATRPSVFQIRSTGAKIDHPGDKMMWEILLAESISKRGLCGLLLNCHLLFVLHSRIPANEGLPELVIEHLRSDLQ